MTTLSAWRERMSTAAIYGIADHGDDAIDELADIVTSLRLLRFCGGTTAIRESTTLSALQRRTLRELLPASSTCVSPCPPTAGDLC